MNKIVSLIIMGALITSIGILFFGLKPKDTPSGLNSEIKNGIQYVTIQAKGGYAPRVSAAKAGIPTKLIVKTRDTYDCSASLAIKPLQFQKILPSNGEEIVDIGVPQKNISLRGVCSMGMYSFVVNFN